MNDKFFTVEEARLVLQNYKKDMFNNRNYKILYNRIFYDFWNSRINKKIMFTVFIDITEIDNLDLFNIKKNIIFLNDVITNKNFIKIDSKGLIVESYYKNCSTQQEMKKTLNELSYNNCVFFFGESGINNYVQGESENEVNIFYTPNDLKRYNEKKHISELPNVISIYAKKYIPQQINYTYFFAESALLQRIDTSLIHRNILKNKPEKFMRDHLLNFLSEHMQHTFIKENELSHSKRELDIYTEDSNGELYFIEIKWLGTSVDRYGLKLGTTYKSKRAKEGVVQSLEYIEELLNTPDCNLRCGYLAIFDARDDKIPLDLEDETYISENLIPYKSYFQLLPIIPLDKTHPA